MANVASKSARGRTRAQRLETRALPFYAYTLMHSFAANTEGAGPQAALLQHGRYLYGLCINGGNPDHSSVTEAQQIASRCFPCRRARFSN